MPKVNINILINEDEFENKHNLKNKIFNMVLFLKEYDLHINNIKQKYTSNKVLKNINPVYPNSLYKLQLIQNKFINKNNPKPKKNNKPKVKLIVNNAKLNKMMGYSNIEIIEKIIFESTLFSIDRDEIKFIIESTPYLDNLSQLNIDNYISSVMQKAKKYQNKYFIFLSGVIKLPENNNINNLDSHKLYNNIKLRYAGDVCINDKMCLSNTCRNQICCDNSVPDSCNKCASEEDSNKLKKPLGICLDKINKDINNLSEDKYKQFFELFEKYFKHQLETKNTTNVSPPVSTLSVTTLSPTTTVYSGPSTTTTQNTNGTCLKKQFYNEKTNKCVDCSERCEDLTKFIKSGCGTNVDIECDICPDGQTSKINGIDCRCFDENKYLNSSTKQCQEHSKCDINFKYINNFPSTEPGSCVQCTDNKLSSILSNHRNNVCNIKLLDLQADKNCPRGSNAVSDAIGHDSSIENQCWKIDT